MLNTSADDLLIISEGNVSNALSSHSDLLSLHDSGPIPVRLLRTGSTVADGNAIYIAAEQYLVQVSPAKFPSAAADARVATETAIQKLGSDLGSVILPVLAYGEINARSYSVFELCRPLSNGRFHGRLQRALLRPKICLWLRKLAEIRMPPSEDVIDRFRYNLNGLVENSGTSVRLRRAGEEGLKVLSDGFVPRAIPMHGDLWDGNIVLRKDGTFAVIDWAGSHMAGYGIYDLIRFALAFRLSKRSLRRELAAHEAVLGGQAELYLAAAIGHIVRNLGEFPLDRCIAMGESCFNLLDVASN